MHFNIFKKWAASEAVQQSTRKVAETPSASNVLVLISEALGFSCAIVGAFLLRFDFDIPIRYLQHLKVALLVLPLTKVIVFRLAGVDRGWWRYFSLPDLKRLVMWTVAASIVCTALIASLGPAGFPRSIYSLDLVLSILISAAQRVVFVMLSEFWRGAARVHAKKTLIYGAGSAGLALLREIRTNGSLGYNVVGFVDDDPRKMGLTFSGVRVLGGGSSLAWFLKSLNIEEVLIAIPSASGAQMTSIVRSCRDIRLKYKTVPGLGEMIEQANLGTQIRPVALEDLLGRQPVQLEQERIAAHLSGQVVLVTGAAGSIGSELCRQIARFHPKLSRGFRYCRDASYFFLEKEFHEKFSEIAITPEIGSIQDLPRLRQLFGKYRPSMVFHAAAFKHVPLMEAHPFEALQNNVLGTYRLASAADDFGVKTFVLISSDKAVRPTNVMGATKRLAELITVGLQNSSTKFVAVRFGNVLGSNGSAIPIYQQQIRDGEASHGNASGHAPFFYDHSRSVSTRPSGLRHGARRRNLRPGYGGTGTY